MQQITKLKLAAIHQLCDVEDKSTEYMLQVMQDICKVNLDTCITYMNLKDEEHKKLFKELNELTEIMIKIEENVS